MCGTMTNWYKKKKIFVHVFLQISRINSCALAAKECNTFVDQNHHLWHHVRA